MVERLLRAGVTKIYLLVESLFLPPAWTVSRARLFFGAGGWIFSQKLQREKREKWEKREEREGKREACEAYLRLYVYDLKAYLKQLSLFQENFDLEGAFKNIVYWLSLILYTV